MKYVNLGSTGLRVSRVCLGMMSFGNDSERPWVLNEELAAPIVQAAVEGGITFFDTADTYSKGASEVATGRLLPKFLTRDEVVVATKVFMPMTPGENGSGLSRKHILSAIYASLARLDMAIDGADHALRLGADAWTGPDGQSVITAVNGAAARRRPSPPSAPRPGQHRSR